MKSTAHRLWIRAVIAFSAFYFLVGLVFSKLVLWAGSNYLKAISNPLALLIFCGALAIHIGYEHFRLNSAPLMTAWHTSLAVAIGGFALAVKANIHDLLAPAGYRPRMLIALLAWPILTAVPAFAVALVVAAVFTVVTRSKIRLENRRSASGRSL